MTIGVHLRLTVRLSIQIHITMSREFDWDNNWEEETKEDSKLLDEYDNETFRIFNELYKISKTNISPPIFDILDINELYELLYQ